MKGLDYGVPTEAERTQQADVLSHAFASKPEDLFTSLDWAGHDNLRVLRRGSEVLACLTMVPMGQFFGGRSVPMTGIAGVAVRPDAARQGVATRLMHEAVRELSARGVALSTLYASTQSLYRRVGYEPAGARFEAKLAPREITLVERSLQLRRPTEADRPAIEAFYAQLAAARPGHLDRGRYIWNRVLLPRFGLPVHGMLVGDGDRIEGYVVYRKPPSHPPWHSIAVTDMHGATPRALRRLWTFLRDLSTSVVEQITLSSSPTDPAYLMHAHPKFGLTLMDNWMVRVTNARAALEARGYPPHLSAALHFELRDEDLPDQAGRFVLRVRAGRGTVEPGGHGSLQIDARGLAALYTGFASPTTLSLLERLRGDADAMDTAGSLFAGPLPWMPEMF